MNHIVTISREFGSGGRTNTCKSNGVVLENPSGLEFST